MTNDSQVTVDFQALLKDKETELSKVKAQMEQIEKEINNLRRMNDQLLTKGIELQGAIKALKEVFTLQNATTPATEQKA
jgi:prefoldin subunit 5